MRSSARVVIIGGGVHGASTLYHLVKEGWTDVMLIEKAELTSGSTWHAAGQITRSVADYTTAAFHHYAIELYEGLEAETGQGISLHQPGGLRLAFNDLELDQLKTHLGVGRVLGYPIELISGFEAQEINPFFDMTGVVGAIWTAGEGHVDPSGVTMAFANFARSAGAEVVRRNRVVEVNALPAGSESGNWQVVTEQGTVTSEHVVDAAGCYGHHGHPGGRARVHGRQRSGDTDARHGLAPPEHPVRRSGHLHRHHLGTELPRDHGPACTRFAAAAH